MTTRDNIKRSFSAKLSLNVLVVVSIFFLISFAVVAVYSHKLMTEESTKAATNLQSSYINLIDKKMEIVEAEVRMMAMWVNYLEKNEDAMFWLSTILPEKNKDIIVGSAIAFRPYYFKDKYYFSPFTFPDGKGEFKTVQLGNEQYDYFHLDWFELPAILGKPVWSEPYIDEGGSGYLISTYSYPIKDKNGDVYAIVTADVALDDITKMVQQIKPYPSSFTLMASRAGAHMAYVDGMSLRGETLVTFASRYKDKRVMDIAKAMLKGESGVGVFMDAPDLYTAVYGPLHNGWSVVTVIPYKEVHAKTSQMHIVLILTGLFGLIVIFILCYISIRRMTKPLSDISKSAISIAGGNFATQLPEVDSDDEVQNLRDSFEYMQTSIVQYISNLEESTAARQKMESELNVAKDIQQSMLPHDFPDNPYFRVDALLRPAKEVGGDLYDFVYREKDKHLYLAVGDVSGKGVPASLVMSNTKASFRFVSGLGLKLSQVMGKINDGVCMGNDLTMFVTLFIARYDVNSHELQYCNAGHNPIVVIEPGKEPYFLQVKPNLAIGLMPGFEYEASQITLAPGTSLVMYTDGVTEAERADKSQYGEQRLLDWCNERIAKGGSFTADSLLEDVDSFTEGNIQNDDITILTVTIK